MRATFAPTGTEVATFAVNFGASVARVRKVLAGAYVKQGEGKVAEQHRNTNCKTMCVPFSFGHLSVPDHAEFCFSSAVLRGPAGVLKNIHTLERCGYRSANSCMTVTTAIPSGVHSSPSSPFSPDTGHRAIITAVKVAVFDPQFLVGSAASTSASEETVKGEGESEGPEDRLLDKGWVLSGDFEGEARVWTVEKGGEIKCSWTCNLGSLILPTPDLGEEAAGKKKKGTGKKAWRTVSVSARQRGATEPATEPVVAAAGLFPRWISFATAHQLHTWTFDGSTFVLKSSKTLPPDIQICQLEALVKVGPVGKGSLLATMARVEKVLKPNFVDQYGTGTQPAPAGIQGTRATSDEGGGETGGNCGGGGGGGGGLASKNAIGEGKVVEDMAAAAPEAKVAETLVTKTAKKQVRRIAFGLVAPPRRKRGDSSSSSKKKKKKEEEKEKKKKAGFHVALSPSPTTVPTDLRSPAATKGTGGRKTRTRGAVKRVGKGTEGRKSVEKETAKKKKKKKGQDGPSYVASGSAAAIYAPPYAFENKWHFHFAVLSIDKAVPLYETKEGGCIRDFPVAIAVQQDECRLLLCTADNYLHVFDVANGKARATTATMHSPSSMVLSPDGSTLVTGSASGARVWHVPDLLTPPPWTEEDDLLPTPACPPCLLLTGRGQAAQHVCVAQKSKRTLRVFTSNDYGEALLSGYDVRHAPELEGTNNTAKRHVCLLAPRVVRRQQRFSTQVVFVAEAKTLVYTALLCATP